MYMDLEKTIEALVLCSKEFLQRIKSLNLLMWMFFIQKYIGTLALILVEKL